MKQLGRWMSLLLLSVWPFAAHCFPFPMWDAKSAALGGTGVATDTRNAPFLNPALSATGDEVFDWMIIFPAVGRLEADPDNLNDSLDTHRNDGDFLDGVHRSITESRSLAVIIPSSVVSGVLFLNERVFHSAQVVGSPNQTGGTSYDIYHKAVTVRESGVSMGMLMDEPYLPLYGFMVGATLKIVQMSGYGYAEPLVSAQLGLNENEYPNNSSTANLDFGIARELGIWKVGIAIKDIFAFDRPYGDTDEKYRFSPQVRFGLAYRSRRTLWEFDMDLSQNPAVAATSESQYLATGFEYALFQSWRLRAGYRINSVGDKLSTTTAGLGFRFGSIELDLAAVQNTDEKGMFGQLSMKF